MAAEALDYTTIQVVSEACETLDEADSHAPEAKIAGMGLTASEGSDSGCSGQKKMESSRAEIDTSAPFESVKEAASRFGGIGFWRPHSHKPTQASQHDIEAVDITKVEEQAAQLEKDLIAKERETLDVLKELETTKMIVEELKLKLQKEASEVDAASNANLDDIMNVNPAVEVPEKENCGNLAGGNQDSTSAFSLCPSSAPGFILMELKQAKLNLTRTTTDLADIRATVESFNKKIEKERRSLEKTHERLSLNSSKISSLEEELSKTRLKLQLAQSAEVKGDSDNPIDISRELQRLSSEAEQYKKMGEAAKSEVFKAMAEIEHTKTRIKTSDIRLVAAKKMKEAARATEAVALAEIKALSSSDLSNEGSQKKPKGVTLSFDEYTSLTSKARDAEEASKRKVMDAMVLVNEANVSKVEILKKVEEATEEVKNSKRVLEDTLNRVEAATKAKLAVEEALRKWRSEHVQRRRTVQNSTKFKNSHPSSHHRRNSRLLDVNGMNLENDGSKPVLRPTLSIGQILSRKLLLTEEFENGAEKGAVKRKMSLGQMLSRSDGDTPSTRKAEREGGPKQLPAKRKKFGFARFTVLMRKQSTMGVTVGLLVLFVLGASLSCDARELIITGLSSKETTASDVSVLQINHQESEGEVKASEEVVRIGNMCTMCEEFVTEALEYLKENKTQSEIIDILHNTCSRLLTFEEQCISLVDYYAPLFFLEIGLVQPGDFCESVNLCSQRVIVSLPLSKGKCEICHQAVAEVLLKLKDPETQLDIIEMLLKACTAVESHVKKCKTMVFEYGPLIFANAEQYLETTDMCTAIHACDSPSADSHQALPIEKKSLLPVL